MHLRLQTSLPRRPFCLFPVEAFPNLCIFAPLPHEIVLFHRAVATRAAGVMGAAASEDRILHNARLLTQYRLSWNPHSSKHAPCVKLSRREQNRDTNSKS